MHAFFSFFRLKIIIIIRRRAGEKLFFSVTFRFEKNVYLLLFFVFFQFLFLSLFSSSIGAKGEGGYGSAIITEKKLNGNMREIHDNPAFLN